MEKQILLVSVFLVQDSVVPVLDNATILLRYAQIRMCLFDEET